MEITKFRSQLSIALEQAAVHLQRLQNALATVRSSAADKLRVARGVGENALRKSRANFLNGFVAANGKIATVRPRLSIVSEQLSVHLQRTQDTLARLGSSASDRLRLARGVGENALNRLQARVFSALVVANGKIVTFGSLLPVAFRRAAVPFQRAHSALERVGKTIADKPRRLREERLARENELQTALASCVDAIIVTNSERRFVAANSNALDLFGVSELNMSNFTIDTFLSHDQILGLNRNHSAFVRRREERHGKCKIRRLNGTLQFAECIFVAHVVPGRHLYRFLNAAPQRTAQLRLPVSYTQDTRKLFVVRPPRHKAS